MPTCNIILDSCTYFRLAQSIRPLLKSAFGQEKYCLGVIKELDKEYEKNPTLKNKFFWVSQREYGDNRKDCFSPSPRQRAGGLNSESWYGDWLGTRDPSIKTKIMEYNEDDVVAMEVIDGRLRKLFDK